MTLLSWQPGYTVGIASVDEEHRDLIDQINQCYVRLASSTDAEDIEQFLRDVRSCIATHFEHEERAMAEAGYAEYPSHKKDHEELLEQLRELDDRYMAHPNTGRTMLQHRLSTWFGHHFSTFDARLHRQLGPQII